MNPFAQPHGLAKDTEYFMDQPSGDKEVWGAEELAWRSAVRFAFRFGFLLHFDFHGDLHFGLHVDLHCLRFANPRQPIQKPCP